MPQQNEDKDFKIIQKEWYEKLKNEGFNDIEDTSHPHSPLKCWHSLRWKKLSPDKIERVRHYYDKAQALLHIYKFQTELERLIWELHSQGHSKYQIEKQISHIPKSPKRESIAIIIKTIELQIK